MELWATWPWERCPYTWQGCWNYRSVQLALFCGLWVAADGSYWVSICWEMMAVFWEEGHRWREYGWSDSPKTGSLWWWFEWGGVSAPRLMAKGPLISGSCDGECWQLPGIPCYTYSERISHLRGRKGKHSLFWQPLWRVCAVVCEWRDGVWECHQLPCAHGLEATA